jgi:hypothetical protein
MKRVIGVALALIVASSALALAGGDVFTAFKTGLGARALGMGGAFVGVGNDATAAYWNPAGLALLADGDTRLAGMSTNLYELPTDLTHMYVGAVTKIANFGIGLAWQRMSVGGTFDVAEQAFVGSLGTDILGFGLLGANVKYYMADNTGISGSGFGFDLGLMLTLGEMVTVGVSASDMLGTQISYDDGQTDEIAALYRAGVALSLVDDMLLLAADLDFGTELGNAHVGLEFQIIDELALRGGIVLTDNFGDYYFSVGAGINVAGLYVDAAYILEETLGNTLVLSAEFSLGELLPEPTPEPTPDVTE